MRPKVDASGPPREPRPTGRTAWLGLATVDSIEEGTVHVFVAAGRRIVVSRFQGVLFAVADSCTPDGCSFEERLVDRHSIECTRTGCRFDIRDGSVVRSPATTPLRCFPVRVVHGHLEVEFPPAAN